MTTYRPLVSPGSGETSGLWFACARYKRGNMSGIRILGGYGSTWEHAAAQAVRACRALNGFPHE